MSESLEPDFAVGDYDAGVQKTFTALYNEVCAIYGVTGSTGTVQGGGAVAAPVSYTHLTLPTNSLV